jgi:XapX domain-containing protein
MDIMKLYLISLAVGLLVGCLYSLLGVKSPAPPAVALVGLLGILIGEQAVPRILQALNGQHAEASTPSDVQHRQSASAANGAKPDENDTEGSAAHSNTLKKT